MKHEPYKLSDARYFANRKMKYLARALFVVEPVKMEGLGTFAVDKHWRMYYDPEMLGEWNLDELAGVVLHECFHLVLDHAGRRELVLPNATEEDCHRWNMAADLAINSVLQDNGITLPEGVLMPGRGDFRDFDEGLSTEEYYRLLLDNPPPQTPRGGYKPGLGGGGSSGTDGKGREWEIGEPKEGEGLTKTEQKRVRRSTVQEIRENVSRGNLGSELEVIVGKLLEPKVDPVQELFTVVKYAINTVRGLGNTSFKRANRRNSNPDFILPSYVQPIPEVRIIIDSSGSMGAQQDLPLAAGVIARVIRALPSQGVKVYCADTDIKSCETVFNVDSLKVVGRGGTRMEVAIPKVDEEMPRPNVIIAITDGETAWPEKQTKAKCIVCLTRKGSTPPNWIKTLEVFDD